FILDVDRLEPTGTGELGQAFGIVRIALVGPSRQDPARMTGANADHRHPALHKTMVEKGRKRTGLQHHPGQPAAATPGERVRKHLRVRGTGSTPNLAAFLINQANVRALVRYVQTSVKPSHGPSSSLKPLARTSCR